MSPLRLAFALALCLPACRRHRGRAAAASPLRWYAHPAEGPAVRLEGDFAVRGALRFTSRAVASAPWPATPIAASAREGDAWRFASEDGTVYAAEGFDGPLRVVAELPTPLVPASTPGYHALRGVQSRGALFVVDVHRRAHAVGFDGRVRTLGLARVITGAFVDARTVLAVTEPGVLEVSRDGGETFRAERPPTGVALRVNVVDGEAYVTSSGAVYRWRPEGMARVEPAPAREAWVQPPREAEGPLRAVFSQTYRLPDDATRVVSEEDGSVTVVEGDALVTVDPARGVALRRVPAPGAECVVHRSGVGPRFVCRHQGWAHAVFAASAAGWTTLRDEARAEPMGPMAFDDHDAAWAVSAPCSQQPARDPRSVCVYTADGARRELRAPFPAEVVAMHAGSVLVIDTATSRSVGPTRVVLVQGDRMREHRLPLSAVAVRSARWEGSTLSFWEPPTADHPRLRLVRGTVEGDSIAWQTVEAPPGATRGVHGPPGVALAVGAHAGALWQSVRGRGFVPMTPPVQGAPEALALSEARPAYCRGPWCRLGDGLSLAFRAAPQASLLTRSTPPGDALAPRPREAQRRVVCRLGASSPGPEMDHGIAATGYTMRWTARGRAATVTWSGDAFNATVSGTLSDRPGARLLGRAVPGARAPLGLLEQCNDNGCDHFLATRGGLRALALGRAEPGGIEAFEAEGGGYLLRFDTVLDATRIVTLVRLDAAGDERARRDFVLVEDVADAHVGRYGDADGLWVRDTDGGLRFYAQEGALGEGARVTVRAPDRTTGLCVDGGAVRGTLRIRERPAQVVGDGWFVEAGAWQQEQLLELTDAGFCTRAIGGGESRDEDAAHAEGVEEHEPVRTFEARAASAETMVGRAWRGRERRALTCVLRAPPSEP